MNKDKYHMISLIGEITETESILVGARGRGWGKWRDVQRLQTSSYKMSKFWGSNVQHDDYS